MNIGSIGSMLVVNRIFIGLASDFSFICPVQVVQQPGEFIISFSGGYHQGFNLGLNKAEAINFGSKRWLEFFPNFKLCPCP